MFDRLPRWFGPYRLLDRLGSGSVGTAYLARAHDRQLELPAPVVVKCLHTELATEELYLRRFRHEARIAVCVESAHVVKIYDAGSVGGALYIAMEYVDGETFESLLQVLIERRIHLPIPVIVDFVAQCLAGVHALHTATDDEGKPLEIVHRDMAPKNVMIGDDGLVRVIDLGLGKSRGREWRTATGKIMGTPGYMAHEQIRADANIDQRADIFTIGVLLHEILTAQRFIPDGLIFEMLRQTLEKEFVAPSSLRSDVPRELDEVVRTAVSPRAEDRFSSALEFHSALVRACGERADSREIARAIDELLADHKRARRKRIERALAIADQDFGEGPTWAATDVFARRGGAGDLQKTDVKTVGDTVVLATKILPPPETAKTVLRRRSAGGSMRAAIRLAGIAFGFSTLVLIGLFFRRYTTPIAPPPSPVIEEPSAGAPVTAVPREIDEPARAPSRPKPPPPPKKKIDAPPAPKPSVAGEPKRDPDPQERALSRLVRCQERAETLRASLDEKDELRKKLNVLLSDISMLRGAAATIDVSARAAAIEKELRAMEADLAQRH